MDTFNSFILSFSIIFHPPLSHPLPITINNSIRVKRFPPTFIETADAGKCLFASLRSCLIN